MVVTLTGENDFGLKAELQTTVSRFVEEHGDLALERLDGQEATYEQLQESLTGLPFLAARKMVVLRSPSANKQFVERAEQLLGQVPETSDVILIEPKLDKRLSYYKYLKSKTDFHEFPPLDQPGLAQWLVKEAKQHDGSISSGDARYLVDRVGANQRLLSNELEKLLLYEPKISRRTIDLLTDPAPQSTVFQLLEAAFAGNARQALRIYGEQRALKVEPPQIIAMLAWQLHVLAVIKTAGERGADEIAKQARMSPFVVRKSQSIARRLSLSELKVLIADLLKIDTDSKRTSIDTDEALQHYIMTLAI